MSYTPSKNDRKKHRVGTSISRGAVSRNSSQSDKLRKRQAQPQPFTTTESSGNVFLDAGFSPGEAGELLTKSNLMNHVIHVIQHRKLTQARAARLFGVTQPRISDLMRGKIDRFSIDGLISMLSQAGMSITIQVKPAA